MTFKKILECCGYTEPNETEQLYTIEQRLTLQMAYMKGFLIGHGMNADEVKKIDTHYELGILIQKFLKNS